MKVKDLIKQLKKLDRDTDIRVLGFKDHCSHGDWECWYSDRVKFEHDDYDKVVNMAGDLDI